MEKGQARPPTARGKLIGLDVGERRIGVAVTDEKRVVALPECVIERRSLEEDVRALCELARAKGSDRFIVGLPLRLDGSHGPEANGVTEFARTLAQQPGIHVEMADERLSTKQAERHLIQSGVRRGRRRRIVDKMAAQIILQNYIDSHQVETGKISE
jgi:putative Holliday junction resolvase